MKLTTYSGPKFVVTLNSTAALFAPTLLNPCSAVWMVDAEALKAMFPVVWPLNTNWKFPLVASPTLSVCTLSPKPGVKPKVGVSAGDSVLLAPDIGAEGEIGIGEEAGEDDRINGVCCIQVRPHHDDIAGADAAQGLQRSLDAAGVPVEVNRRGGLSGKDERDASGGGRRCANIREDVKLPKPVTSVAELMVVTVPVKDEVAVTPGIGALPSAPTKVTVK